MEEKIWEKIIKNLSTEDIIKVVISLGSESPKTETTGNMVFQSVCHQSSSWKLYYYPESKTFFCFRDWEKFNIFTLCMKAKNIDFAQAFEYVCSLLNLNFSSKIDITGFGSGYAKEDWDFFNKFQKLEKNNDDLTDSILNENILNLFCDYFYDGWIKENISIQSMKKYKIKYDIPHERIIIPHFNIDNKLIGIRCRNLNPEANAKYCPISVENKLYNHSLGNHLYGLNFNKNTIKTTKKAMICESEKSVMQSETYFPNHNFVVACCGSNISYNQIEFLIDLGVSEVILGMDWDFHIPNSEDDEYNNYVNKIIKLSKKLLPYFKVTVLLPPDNSFIYKCSPTDMGKEYLLKAMDNKVNVTYDMIEFNNKTQGGENH